MKQLLEWKDEHGNKLSTGSSSSAAPTSAKAPTLKTPNYKDKFESLLKYHTDNPSSTVIDYEIKQITDDRFHIQEKIIGGQGTYSYLRDVVVMIIETGEWVIAIYIDGKPYRVYNSDEGGKGIKNMFKQLEALHLFKFPPLPSKEYKAIMTEAVSFAEDFRLYENLWDD